MEVNDAIDVLIGRRVKIWSNPTGSSDCTDTGNLESYDHPWIRLRRGRTDVICFSVYNVRLIEALEPIEPPTPAQQDLLLRPAAADN
jgi:hypothetical protein